MSTIRIELLTLEDAEAIQTLADDWAIAATTRIPHPYPDHAALEYIRVHLEKRASGTEYVFAVKQRREVVGVCGLHKIEGGHARELGYWIGRPYWGHGFASRAARLALAFAFDNLKLESVGACALETNQASRRVLEKSGLQFTGLCPHNDPLLKRPEEPVAVYQITRPDWNKLRSEEV
jgi:ribosomal-protein-alanine N-acetyltransferase